MHKKLKNWLKTDLKIKSEPSWYSENQTCTVPCPGKEVTYEAAGRSNQLMHGSLQFIVPSQASRSSAQTVDGHYPAKQLPVHLDLK